MVLKRQRSELAFFCFGETLQLTIELKGLDYSSQKRTSDKQILKYITFIKKNGATRRPVPAGNGKACKHHNDVIELLVLMFTGCFGESFRKQEARGMFCEI